MRTIRMEPSRVGIAALGAGLAVAIGVLCLQPRDAAAPHAFAPSARSVGRAPGQASGGTGPIEARRPPRHRQGPIATPALAGTHQGHEVGMGPSTADRRREVPQPAGDVCGIVRPAATMARLLATNGPSAGGRAAVVAASAGGEEWRAPVAADGRFCLGDAAISGPLRVRLLAHVPGAGPCELDFGEVSAASGDLLELDAGSLAWTEVAGTFDAADVGIEAARVVLRPVGRGAGVVAPLRDVVAPLREGSFRAVAHFGTYQVGVRTVEGRVVWLPGLERIDAETARLDLRLGRVVAADLVVRDAQGAPLTNQPFELCPHGGGVDTVVAAGRTDGDGRWRIEALPAGRYALSRLEWAVPPRPGDGPLERSAKARRVAIAEIELGVTREVAVYAW